MTRHDPDAPKLGTVDGLIPKRRVDSRICFKCGARAGFCDHMKADHDIVWLSKTKEHDRTFTRWTRSEVDRLLNLHAAGLGRNEIAEIMNTTRGAVAGVLYREKEKVK